MNTAKRINKCLDDMLALQAEAKRLHDEVDGRKKLVNQETGKKITKKQVLELAEVEITQIKNDLNKLTNNGKSIKGIFTSQYYINDMIQDKLLVENNFEQNFNK